MPPRMSHNLCRARLSGSPGRLFAPFSRPRDGFEKRKKSRPRDLHFQKLSSIVIMRSCLKCPSGDPLSPETGDFEANYRSLRGVPRAAVPLPGRRLPANRPTRKNSSRASVSPSAKPRRARFVFSRRAFPKNAFARRPRSRRSRAARVPLPPRVPGPLNSSRSTEIFREFLPPFRNRNGRNVLSVENAPGFPDNARERLTTFALGAFRRFPVFPLVSRNSACPVFPRLSASFRFSANVFFPASVARGRHGRGRRKRERCFVLPKTPFPPRPFRILTRDPPRALSMSRGGKPPVPSIPVRRPRKV